MRIRHFFSLLAASVLSIAFSVIDAAVCLFRKVVAGPVPMADKEPNKPAAIIVSARAFVLRLVKRERPVLTATWRMCHSI